LAQKFTKVNLQNRQWGDKPILNLLFDDNFLAFATIFVIVFAASIGLD